MVDTAKLLVAIDARGAVIGASKYKTASKSIVGQTDRMGKGFSSIRSLAAKAFAIIGAGALVRKAIKNISEQEETIAQLNAGLKSTNFVSGQTVEGIRELSREMQELTKFSNEAVEATAGIVLSFTNITDDVFPRAIKAIADISTRMGTDLRSTALQVAKALNDPVANLGAMSRAGIQFSKDQKEVIKSLWETGQQAEAQSLILKELERQYAGSAAAARNTLGGALAALGNSFDDLLKVIGGSIGGLKEWVLLVNDAVRVMQGLEVTSVKGLEIFTFWTRQLVMMGVVVKSFVAELKFMKNELIENTAKISDFATKIFNFSGAEDAMKDAIGAATNKLKEQGKVIKEMPKLTAEEIFDKEILQINKDLETTLDRITKEYAEQRSEIVQNSQAQFNFTQAVTETDEATKKLTDEQKELAAVVENVRSTSADTFTDIILGANSAGDAIRSLAQELTRMFLRRAVISAITPSVPGIGDVDPATGTIIGGAAALAHGGIIMNDAIYRGGEAGPEVVMPLTRDSRGDLGVKTSGGDRGGRGDTIFQIYSADVSGVVDKFARDPKITHNLLYGNQVAYSFEE
jgi:hypothetical protein